MKRLLPLLLALSALLVLAPAALASTYQVNDGGDAPDAVPGDDHCATAGGKCTLRAAVQESNAHSGRDTITFGVSPTNVAAYNTTTASAVTDAVTIDGGGTTTVTFSAAAAGPLFQVEAGGTTLQGISFTGGRSGPVLKVDGGDARLDHVGVHDTPDTAVAITGSGARLTSVSVRNAAGTGISVGGGNASLTDTTAAAAGGDGIAVSADGANLSGGTSHANGGNGIAIAAQGVVVSRVVLYGNGGKPIALAPGANGGIAAPSDLRIGPRRSDGSLPLTGTTGGGGIELWTGDPFGPLAPSFLDAFSVDAGAFSYNFATEPAPGTSFGLTVTGGGTSEFATVAVPADVSSPDILRARAVSTTDVKVVPSESLDPGSVQPGDFTLTMAGKDRAIGTASLAPDGSTVTLTSSGWKAGEAGYVQLTGAGVLADSAGNASQATTRLRVAAAPGDFIAPIAGRLALAPRNMCLTHGHGCRKTGTTIRFVTSEPGKATVIVQRGNKRVGKRVYSAVEAGVNAVKFNGRLGGRKLRAGRYRLLLYVQDVVGNVTDQPPIALLRVRRVTK